MAGSNKQAKGSGRSTGGRVSAQAFAAAAAAARSKSATMKLRAAQLEDAGRMGLQIASRDRSQRRAFRQMSKGQQAGDYLFGNRTAQSYMEVNSPGPGKRMGSNGYRAPRTRII